MLHGETKDGITGKPWRGIYPPVGRHWSTDPSKFDELDKAGKIEWSPSGNPRLKEYADEWEGNRIQDVWRFLDPTNPLYPTEKNEKMLERIIKQSSNLDSIVMDCFAGSGATLRVAEQLGRTWIGIDNSAIAIDVIRENIKSDYKYIEL